MNKLNWQVCQNVAYGDGVSLYLGNETQVVEAVLTVSPVERGVFRLPTLQFSTDDAQQIMNGLWHAGFRPRDGAGAIAHVETLKQHLDDLRTVAFHALGITNKEATNG